MRELWRCLMTVLVRDAMQRDVVSIGPEATLAQLEELLIAHRIGGAAVIDGGRLVGVASRSDVVRTLLLGHSLADYVAEELAGSDTSGERRRGLAALPSDVVARLAGHRVRDIMIADPVTVEVTTPIREVAGTFVERRIHRVFVTDADRLVGVVTTLDLARLVASNRV
jgi:CBS domain-containing protein